MHEKEVAGKSEEEEVTVIGEPDPIAEALAPQEDFTQPDLEVTLEDVANFGFGQDSVEAAQEALVKEEKKEYISVNNATVTRPYEREANPNYGLYKASKELYDKEDYENFLPGKRPDKMFDEINNEIKELEAAGRVEDVERMVEIRDSLMSIYDMTGTIDGFVNRPEADFRQGVEVRLGTTVGTRSIDAGNVKGVLKGELAVLRVVRHLGLGQGVQVLLPESCMWVTLTPPTNEDIVAFFLSVSRNKKRIGRMSYGLTYTNMSCELNQEIFAFIKRHITSITIDGIEKEDLGRNITINDFYNLACGFLTTFSPEGVPYRRICNGTKPDGNACGRETDVLIDTDKIAWVDNSRLTGYQKEVLGYVRPKTVSIETRDRYMKDFVSPESRSVTVMNTTFNFRRPFLQDHFDDGIDWIDGIVDVFNRTLASTSSSEAEKQHHLNTFVRTSALRNISHYIDSIEMGDSSVVDRKEIRASLAEMSAVPEIVEAISKAVVKFRNDTILSVVGVPEHKCPSCGDHTKCSNEDASLVSIIPLDVLNMYFLTLSIKYQSNILENIQR